MFHYSYKPKTCLNSDKPKYVNLFCLNYRFISINGFPRPIIRIYSSVLWPARKANKDCFVERWEFQLEEFKQRCLAHPNHPIVSGQITNEIFPFSDQPLRHERWRWGDRYGRLGLCSPPPHSRLLFLRPPNPCSLWVCIFVQGPYRVIVVHKSKLTPKNSLKIHSFSVPYNLHEFKIDELFE